MLPVNSSLYGRSTAFPQHHERLPRAAPHHEMKGGRSYPSISRLNETGVCVKAGDDSTATTNHAPNRRTVSGREREMQEIIALFEAAPVAGAQVLWIAGEPGIGKSTLVHAAAQRAADLGVRVFTAAAGELDGRRSFGLIRECFHLTNLPGTGDPRSHSLPSKTPSSAVDGPWNGADLDFWVSEVAIATLDGPCTSGPCALVLEDLHWADASSLYVLRRLIRHSRSLPLVVVGTYRPLPRPPELAELLSDSVGRDGHHLSLGPLARESIVRIAHKALGAAPGQRLQAQLSLAGGNPLFVLEMLDALRAEGALRSEASDGKTPVAVEIDRPMPLTSLYSTVLGRMRFLAPNAMQILRVAAVLGSHFRLQHVALIRNQTVGELLTPLRDLLASGLLVEESDALAFRHELVRDALYADLPRAVRAGLHRDAAQALSKTGIAAEVVAEHVLRGMATGDEHSLRWLERAAQDLAASSPSNAVDLLRRALALTPSQDPMATDLTADLGMALLLTGQVDEGEKACREALAHTSSANRRASLSQCLAASLLRRGQAAQARVEAQRALDEPLPSLKAQLGLEGVAALAALFLGHYPEAEIRARRLEHLGAILGDAAVGTRALVVQALVLEQQGKAVCAAERAAVAVRLADQHPFRDVQEGNPHLVQAMCLMDTDRFAAATAVLNRGRQIQEQIGASTTLPLHQVGLGFVYFWSGQWDAAMTELETGLSLAEETGTGWRIAAHGLRAVAALGRGDRGTATNDLRLGEYNLLHGEAPYRVEWWQWARMLYADEVRAPSMEMKWLRDAVVSGPAIRDPLVLVPIAPTAVRIAVGMGERALATDLAEAIEDLRAQNQGTKGIAASALAARGLLTGDPALLGASLDLYRHAGRVLELALVAEECSVLEARVGHHARARLHLETALAAYRQVGAPRFASRASRRLAPYPDVIDVTLPPSVRPTHGWNALTATEHRVLRLVAERRSNQEIAQILNVSRRTVETHVSHMLAKMDLNSRGELALQAAGHFRWRLRLDEFSRNEED